MKIMPNSRKKAVNYKFAVSSKRNVTKAEENKKLEKNKY